ncbi:uncharacterized protein [Apostichopus japonicus]|uniref:uncharacterized protein n=1 Tax=Stichopus japonicus TaxID=307972 RepID=UPI003AB45290
MEHPRKRKLNERRSTSVLLSDAFDEWVRQKKGFETKRGEFKESRGISEKDFTVSSTHCGFAKHLLDCHLTACRFCWLPEEQVSCSKVPDATNQHVHASTQTEDSETCTLVSSNQTPEISTCPTKPNTGQRLPNQSQTVPMAQSTPAAAVLPHPLEAINKTVRRTLSKQFVPTISPILGPISDGVIHGDSDSEEESFHSDEEGIAAISHGEEELLCIDEGEILPNETVESEVFPPELEVDSSELQSEESLPDNCPSGENLDIIEEEKCIVSLSKLLELLKLIHGEYCTHTNCTKTLCYQWSAIGTAIIFSWKCEDGHVCGKWYSQNRFCGIFTGNIQFSSAVTISGNNYSKMALYFKVSKVFFVSNTTFLRVQRLYVTPAVKATWQKVQKAEFCKLKDKGLCVAGDARTDSPGHCAQYCTYSFMDDDSSKILHLEVVDVREVGGKSPNMERVGFERGLDFLMKEFKICEVVTDAHVQIKALLKNCPKYDGISHQVDVWHGAKNLVKKLSNVANAKENTDLHLWIPAIRNHFWYSAKECGGNDIKIKSIFLSLLHHIVDEHQWLLSIDGTPGECSHHHLGDDDHSKPYLKKGSPSHEALRSVTLKKQFLNSLPYYKNFKHTGSLESFHNHMLMYANKRCAYSYDGYVTRMLLAAIDHNYHIERAYDSTADGKPMYRAKYSKRSKQWAPQKVKVPKDFGYIPELMKTVFLLRQENQCHLSARVVLPEYHPKNIKPNIGSAPKPSMSVLLAQYQSRFASSPDMGHS